VNFETAKNPIAKCYNFTRITDSHYMSPALFIGAIT